MKTSDLDTQIETAAQSRLEARFDRRKFVRQAGMLGLGAVASGIALAGKPAEAQSPSQSMDTTAEIFTAFLIAEDLATTFYYNGLISPGVIQNVNLAGPGGSATNVTASGNLGNVEYVRAALSEEIAHANLFRTGLGEALLRKIPTKPSIFPMAPSKP